MRIDLKSLRTDGTALLRDGLFAFVVLAALINPGWLATRIEKLNIKDLDLLGIKASFVTTQERLQDSGAVANQVKQGLDDIIKQLKGMTPSTQLLNVTQQLEILAQRAGSDSDKTLATVASQQDAHPNVLPSAAATSGWIFLGKVKPDGSDWAEASTVIPGKPTGLDGTTVKLIGDVYLHAGADVNPRPGEPGWRATQKVLRVLRAGTTIKIAKTEKDPAVGGGTSLWASVDAAG